MSHPCCVPRRMAWAAVLLVFFGTVQAEKGENTRLVFADEHGPPLTTAGIAPPASLSVEDALTQNPPSLGHPDRSTVSELESQALRGQFADVGSTLAALGLGASELNPLGLGTLLAKVIAWKSIQAAPERERPNLLKKYAALGQGAAANNLCVIAALVTGGTGGVLCPIIGWMVGSRHWPESEGHCINGTRLAIAKAQGITPFGTYPIDRLGACPPQETRIRIVRDAEVTVGPWRCKYLTPDGLYDHRIDCGSGIALESIVGLPVAYQQTPLGVLSGMRHDEAQAGVFVYAGPDQNP